MSTIDLNLSRKVDITCRANDSLKFSIGATDEEGNALDITTDQFHFFTIYDNQKEPVMILGSTRFVNFEKNVVINNFTRNLSDDELTFMQKNAYALQKLLNSSRIITGSAYNDSYHPMLIVEDNSERGTVETSEKIFLTEQLIFNRPTVSDPANVTNSSTVALNYDVTKKAFFINVDAASFTLPPNRYLYDLKSASQLFTPIDQYEGVEIIEKSVFESSTTLIYGSFTVKKD